MWEQRVSKCIVHVQWQACSALEHCSCASVFNFCRTLAHAACHVLNLHTLAACVLIQAQLSRISIPLCFFLLCVTVSRNALVCSAPVATAIIRQHDELTSLARNHAVPSDAPCFPLILPWSCVHCVIVIRIKSRLQRTSQNVMLW